jgi:hypothetical protein
MMAASSSASVASATSTGSSVVGVIETIPRPRP